MSTTPSSPQLVQWLTVNDVCEHLGITDKTLRRYIAAGKVPAYRMGGRLLRFNASDINALMEPVPFD